jgi:hypothetical protein
VSTPVKGSTSVLATAIPPDRIGCGLQVSRHSGTHHAGGLG